MRGARRAPVPATRTRRRHPVLALLLALAVGAGVAVWLILAAFPVGAAAADDAVAAAPAGPGPVELVGPATVVASSSCVGADPRDTVAVDGPAGRRLVPLDGCGSPMGARMTVRVAFVGGEPADAPARVLGTGSSAALVAEDTAASPLTGRLAILLTGVAGLGTAGLLVAVAHERRRRTVTPRTDPPARRRPVTTTTSRPATPARRRDDRGADRQADRTADRQADRTADRQADRRADRSPAPEPSRTHRPASRPARSPRAGRPAGLDAGRRLPAQRAKTSRSSGSRGRGSSTGTRRPAAGPHRG